MSLWGKGWRSHVEPRVDIIHVRNEVLAHFPFHFIQVQIVTFVFPP